MHWHQSQGNHPSTQRNLRLNIYPSTDRRVTKNIRDSRNPKDPRDSRDPKDSRNLVAFEYTKDH